MRAVKRTVEAEWKSYNANTRDRDIGDCVKRSLSLAYGMDYDAVSVELNKIRKELGYGSYKIAPVFGEFIAARGDKFHEISEQITEEEFCKQNPTGTYLLLVGNESMASQGKSNHMCCIIDGDIYDSWNSSNYIVTKVCEVSAGERSVVKDLNIDDIRYDLVQMIEDYLARRSEVQRKYVTFSRGDVYQRDNQTLQVTVYADTTDAVPYESAYYPSRRYRYRLILKLNIKYTLEENEEILRKKLKQKLYDYTYNFLQDFPKSEKLHQKREESQDIDKNLIYYAKEDHALIQKLPEWSWGLINNVHQTNDYYGYKYVVYMRPKEGDPDRNEVTFMADTLRELKEEIEEYGKNYTRYF